MKNKFVVWFAPVVLAGGLALPAAAQSTDQSSSSSSSDQASTAQSKTATPGVTQRQKNQQRRIRQGVNSGQLTPHETKKLEGEEGKIQADKLEAKSDGTVTLAERAKLQHEENKASHDIYRQKHDAQVTTPKPAGSGSTATPGVAKRQVNQQARIKQGVNSGQLTKGETRRLEAEQGKIHADKLEAKSDGKVTPAERAKLQHEENKVSKDIYRKKHNSRTAPPKK